MINGSYSSIAEILNFAYEHHSLSHQSSYVVLDTRVEIGTGAGCRSLLQEVG